MPITSLRFTNVGPFEEVEFEFDEHVNVFTGPNNSGKSTALWVLAEIIVYPFGFPEKLYRGGGSEFEISCLVDQMARTLTGSLPVHYGEDLWNDEKIQESLESLTALGYTNYLPALRRSTDFRSKGPTSETKAPTPERRRHPPFEREQQRREALFSTDPSLVSDEVIVQKIVELDYRAYRLNRPSIRQLIDKVAEISSTITEGFPLYFVGIAEDQNGLFPQFRTPDGDVPLDVLSQGTQSIIQWLAHFMFGYAQYYDYPPDLEERPGILIIDEIDAHLHPSWQRRIIPTLIEHFPNLQIFCSTHSPLVLAGLKEGQVQLLRRDEEGKVTVSRNETDIIGWSADEILRNFLDVPSPTDLATVQHVERLQELRRKESLSAEESEELEQLRLRVNQDLMGGPIAGQIERLSELLRQAKPQVAPKPEPPTAAKPRTTRRRRGPGQ